MIPRRVFLVAGILFLLTLAGIWGFHRFEGLSVLDAFYLTVITLTTVGYGDIVPHTSEGKLFGTFLIIFGVGTVAYGVSSMYALLLSDESRRAWIERRRRRMVDQMDNHVIICGYGQMGRSVAANLTREQIPFMIIERDELAAEQARQKGLVCLDGNASEEGILEKAGIERARSLIAAVDSDAESVFIVLTARAIRPDIQIIARANREDSEPKLRRAGASRVILPYLLSGQRVVSLVSRPSVADFLDVVMHSDDLELRMEEIIVPAESTLVGKTLADTKARESFGVTVLAICSPGRPVLTAPKADDRIEAGARLIILGTDAGLRGFEGRVERS
ncbi:MAG: potassium channel protein [Planctomycetes bacterium]|nr:potassium channel protein [Planctomycetota bacterium]